MIYKFEKQGGAKAVSQGLRQRFRSKKKRKSPLVDGVTNSRMGSKLNQNLPSLFESYLDSWVMFTGR